MYIKSVTTGILLIFAFSLLAASNPIDDLRSTFVTEEFSSKDRRGLGWDNESPQIYVHYFSGPVNSPDYPPTMRPSGHMISRAVIDDGDALVVDEIWRRPVSLVHMQGPAAGEDSPRRTVAAHWDKNRNVLTVAYVLSAASETFVTVDRVTLDTANPRDWVAMRVGVQSKLVQTDMNGGVFQSCSIHQQEGGRTIVELNGGDISREVEFFEFIEMLPSARDMHPDYKPLHHVADLSERVAASFSDQ